MVPREFIQRLKKVLIESMQQIIVLAGYPIVDIKLNFTMVLYDVTTHLKQPSKVAASLAERSC